MTQFIPPAIASARARIGQTGSRFHVATPALILDLDAFEANVALMAARCKEAGVMLRPHAKSHKSRFIGLHQIKAGAVGLCCAKLGEAEALAGEGLTDFLITSPFVSAETAVRACTLAQRVQLTLVVDHPLGVRRLDKAARDAGVALDVVIDIDVGLRRTGVGSAQMALELARAIEQTSSLALKGVQAYGGHWQHLANEDGRRAMTADGMARLNDVIDALNAAGFEIDYITGGGTGTALLDLEIKVFTELQCGSYVFMDRQYRDALGESGAGAFRHALFVQSEVVSANAEKWVTVDAGLKAFSTDGPLPLLAPPFHGEGADFFYYGDEHGGLPHAATHRFKLGERVEFIPPHCDPTVDRYDWLHLVRGDVLIDIVPIEARGRSA